MVSKGIILIILMGIYEISVACNDKVTHLGHKSNYHSASKELLFKIEKSDDRNAIAEAAMKVADLADPVLKELVNKNPKCSEIVSFIQKKKLEMYNLKPNVLEDEYHEGSVLPTFPDDCHDLKELIVHPATVVSLAKFSTDFKKAKAHMKEEIEEVMMHLEAL